MKYFCPDYDLRISVIIVYHTTRGGVNKFSASNNLEDPLRVGRKSPNVAYVGFILK